MLLDQRWNNSDGLFLGTAHGSPLQCSPIKCVRNFCMVRIVLGWTKPLGKTDSEPLWTRALVCCWFVIAQMWETLTSSHSSPWSQMEGAKMKQARPMGRKADTPSVMSSCKGQTECPEEPRSAHIRFTFNHKIGHKQAGGSPPSQTRHLPACDRSIPTGHSLSRAQLNPEQTPLSKGLCFT